MKTIFVTLTDKNYFPRAERTIKDLRTRGEWYGPIVVITLDFNLTEEFIDYYHVIEKKFSIIDKTELLKKIGKGFSNWDGREITKLSQWEKLHVFDEYFIQWERVIFLDAGLRILDSVKYLLEMEYKGLFLSPNDAGDGPIKRSGKIFNTQISHDNENIVKELLNDFGEDILKSEYFLNCIWIYDTDILKIIKKDELIETMNKYPLCKTNEMAVMNLIINFKYKLWKEFNWKSSNEKYLFDWCEHNIPGTKWSNFCFLKYPVTIGFNE